MMIVNFISVKQVYINARVRVRPRVSARAKLSKCSKSSKIHFAYVSAHSHHLSKNRAHADTRAFSVRMPYKGKNHTFLQCLGVWCYLKQFLIVNSLTRAYAYVHARAKIQNAPNRLKIHFAYVFCHILSFFRKSRTRRYARVPCAAWWRLKCTVFVYN